MKKVLLSVCLAALMVAAFAVTALAVDVSGPGGTVQTGDTVTITVSGEGQGTSGKISVQGLEIVGVSGNFSTPTDFLVIGDAGGLSSTYTCRVTAGAGEAVSFTVSDVIVSNGQADSAGTPGSWQTTVAAAEPTVEPSNEPSASVEPAQPTDAPTAQPTDEQGGEQSSEPTAPSGQQTSGTARPSATATRNGDTLPKTADASMDLWTLAVIAGAAAAVAAVAGKKVFSSR